MINYEEVRLELITNIQLKKFKFAVTKINQEQHLE